MEIRIIDNSGINHFLDFDLKKANKKMEFHLLTSFIKECFKEQVQKIHDLIPFENELIIKVHLEQELQSHDAKPESTTLACFDREFSNEKEYVFRLYYPTIKEIAFFLLSENTTKINTSQFHNTILHELIHAIDILILKETLSAHLKDYRLGKSQSHFLVKNIEKEKLNSQIQWAFLSTVELFRNEGISVLGEKLLGNFSNQSEFKIDFEVSSYFKNLLTYAVQMSINTHFASLDEDFKIFEEIRTQSLMAYHIGDIILVKLIGKLDPSLENLCKKTVLYLLGQSELKPTQVEAKALLKYAFQMDMSDYINALVNCDHHEIQGAFMSKETLFKLCAVIQNEHNSEAIRIFSENKEENSDPLAKTLFLSLMQSTVYSCMTNEELIFNYNQFVQNSSPEDIMATIKEQATFLLPFATEKNNEIAQWALTYLFDEEDLIFDNISLLGCQDDWIVLDAAIQMVTFQNEN